MTREVPMASMDAPGPVTSELMDFLNACGVEAPAWWDIDGGQPLTGEAAHAHYAQLRALALPHADQPGYREEWRP